MIKGIGIVLMIFRHARGPYSDFVLLFHMAIFFMASGYLYKPDKIVDKKSIVNYIAKKIKGLYIPYVIYSSIFVLLNNVFLKLNVYTNNSTFLEVNGNDSEYLSLALEFDLTTTVKEIAKIALFRGGTQIGGALWFFQTLFLVLVIYAMAEYFIIHVTKNPGKRVLLQTLLSIILLTFGWVCDLCNISLGGLNRVFSVFILVHMGFLMKQYEILNSIFDKCNSILVLVCSIIILCLGYKYGTIGIVDNNIGNPLFFLVMSLAGWMMLFSIVKILNKYNILINSILVYIGQKSIPIIALHFLCFKIVNYISVIVYGMENYMVAAFPVLMTTEMWWVLYVFVGISVPLILRYFSDCVIERSKIISRR